MKTKPTTTKRRAKKTKKRLEITSNVRLRAYTVIADSVEGAIEGGISKAYKHTAEPGRELIAECVNQYVMNVLCELIDFGDELP